MDAITNVGSTRNTMGTSLDDASVTPGLSDCVVSPAAVGAGSQQWRTSGAVAGAVRASLAVVARLALRGAGGAPLRAGAGTVAPPRLHVRVVRAALPPLVRMHHGAYAAEEVRVYELSRTLIKKHKHSNSIFLLYCVKENTYYGNLNIYLPLEIGIV